MVSLNIDSLKTLIASVVKDSSDKVIEHVTTAFKAHKKDEKDSDANIFGLREQIIGNLIPPVSLLVHDPY